jgi:hypothetical protein
MRPEQPGSKSARVRYRPIGIASSIIGGLVASQVFRRVWKRATRGDKPDAPKALESEYSMREILLAAVIQGAIFAGVTAAFDRGDARAFERWTGQWPGD